MIYKQSKRSMRQEKEAIDAMKRDNDLLYYNEWNDRSAEYNSYLYQVSTNADYINTVRANTVRYKKGMKDIIKKFGFMEYFFIAIMATATIGGSSMFLIDQKGINNSQSKDIVNDIAIVALVTLISIIIATCVSIDFVLVNTEQDILSFYDKLTIRCFDFIKQDNPDLDENILRKYNPAMARVISALMVANMTDMETQAIYKIVDDMTTQAQHDNGKKQPIYINQQLQSALGIIKSALQKNPMLYNEILNVYRGGFPKTFVLNQKCNTR